MDSPSRSLSPTSPTPDNDATAWQAQYFCKFPGCNKGYASTDGVRKHCRKHHPEWLNEIDRNGRENNQKHSASNYCSTQPAEPAAGEFAPLAHARKRSRTDSGSLSMCGGSTPSGTPRLDPSAPRRELPASSLDENTRTPIKKPEPSRAEIAFPFFGELSDLPAPMDASDRPLLSALAALDERSSAWPHKGGARPSQNFFSLSAGMPVPKRGNSLTNEAMLELARECEVEDKKSEGLADLNSFFLCEAPDRDSSLFLSDVWAV